MKLAMKELAEARCWLRIIGESGYLQPERLAPLIEESHELSRMMGASVATARSRMGETWNSATYDGIGHASGTGAGAGLLTDDRLHTCTLAH